jgi:50S ribosomal subunit-associated GTPase HflX
VTSVLGISAFYHDSAAAIIVDGKLLEPRRKKDLQEKSMMRVIQKMQLIMF